MQEAVFGKYRSGHQKFVHPQAENGIAEAEKKGPKTIN
jgi:hypothetical protein